MKQQIKCPHCNKLFPIEDSLKHEAQELRKKLQSEEQKKSKERQRVLEQQFSDKLEKQNLAHEKELEKIKDAASKKIKDEAKKQALAEIKKINENKNKENIWNMTKNKMIALNIFFLSNSEKVALLLSTISVIDAKMEN